MRVLIVDDEPLARRGLRMELSRMPGVEIAGECANGGEAVRAIAERAPDLVLLDVQLPGLSGFDVIARIGASAMPPVVFVSAYDRYALRAFEVSALDYVLKPVDPERLRDAVDRAAQRIVRDGAAALAARLERLLERMERAERDVPAVSTAPPSRVAVNEGGRLSFVGVDDIDWVEGAGNYVRLHVGARTHVIRSTMHAMAGRLGSGFVMIRRSALVNARAVRTLEPYGKGSYVVLLR